MYIHICVEYVFVKYLKKIGERVFGIFSLYSMEVFVLMFFGVTHFERKIYLLYYHNLVLCKTY